MCTLKEKWPSSEPGEPSTGLEWEEVLAMVLRQPLLATELGLIHRATLDLATSNPFAHGGYLFVDLATGSDYHAETTASPDLLARFAARIPPLDDVHERPVFASVLFPVDGIGGDTFDEVFVEADAYDGGFARAVHGSQARSSAQVEPDIAPPSALPPVKDTGIRLGWDDEQVTIWLNRQYDVNAYGSGPSPDSPLGVAGYRVDVQEEGQPDGQWNSLAAVHGDLELAGISLGPFDGELAVETIPVNHTLQANGEFWLPSHFASWAGGSIVLTDPQAFQITGRPDLSADAAYQAVLSSTPLLRYGRTYRFRVRLMDLTGGGPTADDDHEDTAGAAPTATVPFRRFVPPGPVRVAPDGGLLADGKTSTHHIRRPLLGYPDIVYTDFPNAMTLLLADTPAAKADKREAALPDPDVTHLQIDVLVRTPSGDPAADSDMSLSYTPLYSTLKEFPPDVDQPLVLRAVFEDVHHADDLKDRVLGPLDPLVHCACVRLVLTHRQTGPAQALGLTGGTDRLGTPRSQAPRALTGRAQAPASTGRRARHPGGLLAARPAIHPGPRGPARSRRPPPARCAVRPRGSSRPPVGPGALRLTLSAPAGTRLVLGASDRLRHTLNPDRSSITFGARDDLGLRWLVCVRLTLDRDWTWDALAPVAFTVRRDGATVGDLALPATVNPNAARRPETPDRGTGAMPDRDRTEVLFLDAYDPKTGGEPPHETQLTYSLTRGSPPARSRVSRTLTLPGN